MLRALLLATSALAILFAGSAWLAFYPPVPEDLDGAENLDAMAMRVRIPVADADSLDGWLLRGHGDGVIVMFHGYGRKHDRMWRYAGFLRREGYTLLTVDFRSSRAAGRMPTTLGALELVDARATWDWMRAQPFGSEATAALLGESLGASVALLLAAERDDIAAVVADCPFATSDRAIADTFARKLRLPRWPAVPFTRWVGVRATGFDPGALDVEEAMPQLADRPLFFVHTARDDRMAPQQARDLRRAAGAKDEIWMIEDAGHNEGWQMRREEYERRIAAFFAETLRGTPLPERIAVEAR